MACDEDVAIVFYYYLICLEEERPVRKFWTHPINQKRNLINFLNELREDEKKFFNFTRMSINSFDYLLELISDKIKRQNTNYRRSVTPAERLLITLR